MIIHFCAFISYPNILSGNPVLSSSVYLANRSFKKICMSLNLLNFVLKIRSSIPSWQITLFSIIDKNYVGYNRYKSFFQGRL